MITGLKITLCRIAAHAAIVGAAVLLWRVGHGCHREYAARHAAADRAFGSVEVATPEVVASWRLKNPEAARNAAVRASLGIVGLAALACWLRPRGMAVCTVVVCLVLAVVSFGETSRRM